MNSSSTSDKPSKREIRHKYLRYTSRATLTMATLGFPPALFFYVIAIISCWGSSNNVWGCNILSSLPWIGFVISLGAYFFIVWIINDLGSEDTGESQDKTPSAHYSWRHAKNGYYKLDKNHHHHVRHVHRVVSIGLAGLATYVSFQFFEGDTLFNLLIAVIVYVLIGEVFNWKTYDKLQKKTR